MRPMVEEEEGGRVREPGQTQVRVLALVYAVSGLLLLVSAATPLSPSSPLAVIRTLGVAGVAVAVALPLLGRRWPAGTVHAAFALFSVLVAVAAAVSVTAVGVVGLGPAVIAACLYAAHAFPVSTGRVHVLLLLSAATAGALLSPAGTPLVPWSIVPVTGAAVFEVHGLLVRRLQAAADLDPLTGVANRRHWHEVASRDLVRAHRAGRRLSVVLIDLDGFKAVNDVHGHAAGDELLRELARCWQRELRREDLLGRHGGDEFVISLPGTSPSEAAALVARLRSSHPMPWSAGIATSDEGCDATSLLARADADLYAHKRARQSAGPRDEVPDALR
ncbi:GGDEF domain-containing protein [Streptomyces sp. NP160]|uniref:GGDEF domain-containing protein n=1 Tax=Streptomyces sp. NP160 TaxID=2586637 RepID=UPI00111BC599|nr:GGDEF domain-containing protein [Streptomyces sp. NP160]TNM69197.1 GGDEF domain-containing protein [Streptomyces sp. NP160]